MIDSEQIFPSKQRRCTQLMLMLYMLFAGWSVRMVKNCDRGLENTARGRRPRAAFSRPTYLLFFKLDEILSERTRMI